MEFSGESALADALDELCRIEPREILFSHSLSPDVETRLRSIRGVRLSPQEPGSFDLSQAQRLLHEQFGVVRWIGLDVGAWGQAFKQPEL